MAARVVRVVQETRLIKEKPDVVWTVLTTPADMVGWLCNEARCEPYAGGVYQLRWFSGYTVHGKVLEAKKPKHFAVSWQGTGEPRETTVRFTLKRRRAGTEVRVRHSGFGSGVRWGQIMEESHKGWARSIENLQYLVETGVDLRDARRPLMGINLGEPLTPEMIKKEGIDVKEGVYIDGVIDGLSAKAAGLQKGDVIVAVDGRPVPSFSTLTTVLQSYVAGDHIEVAYVRGKQHATVMLELKPRPMPDIPADDKALSALLKERYDKVQAELAQALNGVSEEKASRAPAAGEWSAKQTLGHLTLAERDLHTYLADLIVGDEKPYYPANPSIIPERLAAVLASAPTVSALLKRLAQDQAETLKIVAALRPEIRANKARYRRIGQAVYDFADHVHEHVGQIKAAIAAAG